MWRIGVIIVVVGFASVALSRPAGSVLAQCGSAYTDEMAGLRLTPHAFHGEWNYTLAPARPTHV